LEGLEKDGIVKINGLGTFKVTDVASRSSVNVNTGEKIEIKGHKKLTFLPADALKEKVNQPFAMFEPVEIDESYVDEEEEIAQEEANDEIVVQNEEQVDTVSEIEAAEETTKEAEEMPSAPTAETNEPIEDKAIEDNVVDENEKHVVQAAEEKNEIKQTYPITEQAGEEPKKKKSTLLYSLLIIAAILIAVIIYLYPQMTNKNSTSEVTVTTIQEPQPAVVQNVDTMKTVEVVKEEPYTFTMLDELAAKSVGAVGRGDTLLYVANDNIATHIVAADETLTRIALKYFGDKRLWPYIVQYNKLHDPNGLSKGMKLLIPRLIPTK